MTAAARLGGGVALAIALAAGARADPGPPDGPPPPRETRLTTFGAGVLIGAGETGFAADAMRQATDRGFLMTARVVAGTRSRVGIEASYVGSRHDLHGFGAEPGARLVGRAVAGGLRLNLPLYDEVGGALVPFWFGGAGWLRLRVDPGAASGMAPRDDAVVLPLGAGLAYAYRGLLIDLRVLYRATLRDDLARDGDGRPVSLGSWAWEGTVGFEL